MSETMPESVYLRVVKVSEPDDGFIVQAHPGHGGEHLGDQKSLAIFLAGLPNELLTKTPSYIGFEGEHQDQQATLEAVRLALLARDHFNKMKYYEDTLNILNGMLRATTGIPPHF